jgi:hypothetical protein
MPEIEELDAETLRAMVRQRLQARTHWMILLSDHERHHLPDMLDAIDAQPQEGTARVRVDLWGLDLSRMDAEDGTMADLGSVLLLSWPRPAMQASHLHALVSRLFSPTMPIAMLLERPIIVPIARADVWRAGEQLNALRGWLQV